MSGRRHVYREKDLDHVEQVTLTGLAYIQNGLMKNRKRPVQETLLLKWLKNTDKDPLELDRAGIQTRLLPQLMAILRDCLLHHRWPEAVQVLRGVATERKGDIGAIWRAGNETFYNIGSANQDAVIQQLVQQLKTLAELNVHRVVMEYVFYLLTKDRIQDAQFTLKVVPKDRPITRRTTESEYDKFLLSLYRGLVWYVEWLQEGQNLEQLKKDSAGGSAFEFSNQIVQTEDLLKGHANNAVKCFQDLEQKPGVWDIFIEKYVQLLEYLERSSEIGTVLETYCEKNPDNPNTHRYLYKHLKQQEASSRDKIQTLEALADLSPSDELVLDLVDLMQQLGNEDKALTYLFYFLDYDCWKYQPEPWKIMVDLLEVTPHPTTLSKLWESREVWWAKYHFNVRDPKLTEQTSLLFLYKAAVAIKLQGRGNEFAKKVECINIDYAQKLSGYTHIPVYKTKRRVPKLENSKSKN